MIYERHLIRNLLSPLAIILMALVSLVWLNQVMKLAFIIELGTGIAHFLLLTISAMPTILLSIFPLAISVACFWGYSFLSADRELIALMTSGLSNMDLAKPALKLVFLLTLIGYLFSFYISPASYHLLKENVNLFKSNYISSVVSEHTFNKLSNNLILYIDRKDSDNFMSGIIIFDNRNPKEPAVVFAEKGALLLSDEIPIFELYKGVRQIIDKYGDMNQMTFSNLTIALPPQAAHRPASLMDLQEYDIFQLFSPDPSLPAKRLKQINAEKHQRIIWPAYSLALTMITLGIFLRHPYSRTGNKIVIIKVVFAIAIALYLHFTFNNMASSKPSFVILCYLNLIATTVAGYLLLRQPSMTSMTKTSCT